MNFNIPRESNKNSIDSSNQNPPSPGDTIIILKKVKSIRQLKNTEKEWVRLCYKEAVLKGFVIVNDIQCYIASKTKIWIERTGIEYLKKSEEEEDRRWYLNMAKNHYAYVSVYRKTMDEIEEYKKELWSIISGPKATNMEKIQAIKEQHNMTKTQALLIRDLPFVTNLSKYYNRDLVNGNCDQQNVFHNTVENEKNEKEIIEQKVSERFRKVVDESALFTLEQKRKMDIITSSNEKAKITDPVMESMRKQLTATPKDIFESMQNKDYQETIRKIKEIED